MPVSSSGMEYEWVAGKYYGEEAKRVSASAAHGLGYYRMSDGQDGNGSFIVVAFTRPLDKPRPHHLMQIADPKKIDELEKKRKPFEQPSRRGKS